MLRLYIILLSLAVIVSSYCLGYYAGLEDRPATVPCFVEIPSFTKGQTFFRATTCTLSPTKQDRHDRKDY